VEGVASSWPNTYYDWLIDDAFLLVPPQGYVGTFLMTFKDYPQQQKAASFTWTRPWRN
jgi:arylsulfatase